ncbi:DinB family protein [Ekhidna sp. To15]|uniref:DinB family protein n=1 Tax=Ekhidna sp. To15 TaxID=3395267 RepID=UPI003F528BD3
MKRKLFTSILMVIITSTLSAQYAIKNVEGYTPQMGALISMLDDLKARVTNHAKGLDQAGTDFLLDDEANRIGALILHLAATEFYYQKATFYDEKLDEEKDAEWLTALNLGGKAREELKGKPISYYLDKWDKVRAKTKEVLKTKDDEWLTQLRDSAPGGAEYNYYWAWYHVMEHQANHMGQIVLIKKRIEED